MFFISKILDKRLKSLQSQCSDIINYLRMVDTLKIDYLFSIKKELIENKKELGTNKNKGVVYTCLTGEYDNLFVHTFYNPDWDYICFTDNQELIRLSRFGNWMIRPLEFNNLDQVRNARWHKLHPHILLNDYEYSIYLDANIDIKTPYIFACVHKLLFEDVIFSIPNHFTRDCIYEEAKVIIDNKIDDSNIVKKQIDIYEKDGFPKNYGLTETSMMFRQHNNVDVIKIMNDWWYFIENYSKRDQLSLHYVLWKNNYDMVFLTKYPIKLDTRNFNAFKHLTGLISVNDLYYKSSLGLI